MHHRDEQGRRLPFLVWRFPENWRAASSAAVGGGIGDRAWILNAQVAPDYARTDLAAHIAALARSTGIDADPDPDPDSGPGCGSDGSGVGLLTAADVTHATDVHDAGVVVRASVGIRLPVLAGTSEPWTVPAPLTLRPGTINLVVLVPHPLTDGALVNVLTSVTEAKVQALFEAGVRGTGTASDAIVVACPRAAAAPERDPFGGPLSTWGGSAARASYAAVLAGVAHSRAVMAAEAGGDASAEEISG